jgi:hypothetical protein
MEIEKRGVLFSISLCRIRNSSIGLFGAGRKSVVQKSSYPGARERGSNRQSPGERDVPLPRRSVYCFVTFEA